MTDKNELLRLLTSGLILAEEDRRTKQLGDRGQYIGISDISRGSECIRASVATKYHAIKGSEPARLEPESSPEDMKKILQRLLTLSRGHWVEAGIGHALSSLGLNTIHQLEIVANYQSSCGAVIPVKGHLDFTLAWNSPEPTITILEIKSYGKDLRETLYTSYESQIKLQVGLLYRLWNIPCFSVKDEKGNYRVKGQTFPDLCKQLFGITLPDRPDQAAITGWVVCISPGDCDAFGPYTPNLNSLSWLLELGAQVWDQAREVSSQTLSLNDILYHEGFHPLCDWCDHNSDCPKYSGTVMPEYEKDMEELNRLKEQFQMAKARLDEHQKRMELTYQRISANAGKRVGWLRAVNYEYLASTSPGRETVDKEKLVQILVDELKCDEETANEVKARVFKKGQPYTRSYLRRVNHPAQEPAGSNHGCETKTT